MVTWSRSMLVAVVASGLAGCGGVKGMDQNALLDIAGTAVKGATFSDADAVAMANDACAASDQQNQLASLNSEYQRRLNRVVSAMPSTIGGARPNYRVYLTSSVNAWAMSNGCIRVYSGLMDLMNDDELRGVIGHEEGHVALGHTKRRMQVALGTDALHKFGAANANAVVSGLSRTQAADLAEKIINAQFSQAQETEADNFSFDLLTQRHLDRHGLKTAFDKLAALEGGKSGGTIDRMVASHPPSPERAANIQHRLDTNT